MNEFFLMGLGLFLIIVAWIDWKAKAIPSILLTGGLFIVVALNQVNLFYGILAFILSYLLYEADFYGGVADIKIFTMFGFLCSSFLSFGFFIGLFAVLGMTWKTIYLYKHQKETECPFLPVFVFIFIGMMLLRLI